jgi:hypothetical protein
MQRSSTAFSTSLYQRRNEKIREKMEKLIEVNRRLRQPLFPPFCGAFRRRLVLREGLLR